MKYLKLFESFDETYNDLEEMCIGTVAYITDDIYDFTYKVTELSKKSYEITFFRRGYSKFEWCQVKDRIIHLLELLENNYDEVPESRYPKLLYIPEYTLDDYTDMLLDNIKDDAEIKLIRIIVKLK